MTILSKSFTTLNKTIRQQIQTHTQLHKTSYIYSQLYTTLQNFTTLGNFIFKPKMYTQPQRPYEQFIKVYRTSQHFSTTLQPLTQLYKT